MKCHTGFSLTKAHARNVTIFKDFTIRNGSTPTFLYFDLYIYQDRFVSVQINVLFCLLTAITTLAWKQKKGNEYNFIVVMNLKELKLLKSLPNEVRVNKIW